MMRMIAAVRPVRPDFVFLTGWEAVLVPMLLIGCDGGTNATSGVVPELTRKLYDLTRAGQIDEAMRLQYRLLELFDAMLYSADFPEGFRAAVELRGFQRRAAAASRRARSQQDRLCRAAKRAAVHPGRLRLVEAARPRLPAADRQHRQGPHQPHRRHGAARTLRQRGAHVNEALGLLETTGLTPTLAARRRHGEGRRRAGPQCELNDFYGVCTKIAGKTAAVSTAIEAGRRMAERMGGQPVADVIPRCDAGEKASSARPNTTP